VVAEQLPAVVDDGRLGLVESVGGPAGGDDVDRLVADALVASERLVERPLVRAVECSRRREDREFADRPGQVTLEADVRPEVAHAAADLGAVQQHGERPGDVTAGVRDAVVVVALVLG
jgi:hypothetical protein